jgi:neutral ceramidase
MWAADSVDRSVVVSLANGFMQYVATADEYGAQYYEGGSTLYGPAEAAMFARQLAALTGRLSRKDQLPPDAAVVIEADTAGGRKVDPPAAVTAADTVAGVGRAWCEGDTLHARVGLARRGGWIVQRRDEVGSPLVEIVQGDSIVAMDDDPRLELRLAPSRGEMPWEVRWQAIEPGSYAIRVGTGSVSARVACPDGKAQ